MFVRTALAIVALLIALPLAAQESDNKARARELAIEAGDLLDAGDFEAAFDRSDRAEGLYHAPTHLQMMGEALEGLGRLADALVVYERLAAEPIPAGATSAFIEARKTGEKRLRELIAIVPSMLVKVPVSDGVRITIDGDEYGSGSARRLDPGEHVVVVEADGYERAVRTVKLVEKGGVEVVEIDLVPLYREPQPALASPDAAVEETSDGFPYWPSGVAFAIGGVGLLVGTITGAMSLSQVGDLEQTCAGTQCSANEASTIDDIETLGNVSTAMFIAGGVFAAAGVVLVVVAGDGDREVALGPGAIALRGSF